MEKIPTLSLLFPPASLIEFLELTHLTGQSQEENDLDSKNTRIVFDIRKELAHDYRKTIIAVTHDNNFAEASDKTIELAHEKIV